MVCTGSLAAARLKASRATSSLTPDISYSKWPGCTNAAQYSTLPFPFPCLTSRGFLVIGLSGKTRIHIFPCRFTYLVMARRAASICRAVKAPRSIDFKPYSPKLTVLARCAKPRFRPLCCLRNLVLLGCSICDNTCYRAAVSAASCGASADSKTSPRYIHTLTPITPYVV